MTNPAGDATVVIATKNRKDDLRKAVASALAQVAHPQVLVMDDGSTDGTSEMIRGEFPAVQLERAEQSAGYIVQRNRGAAIARTEFIFSIDDDAEFSSPNVVSQTLAEFSDRRVGAVAIPLINVNLDNRILQLAPDNTGIYVVSSYIGTAHALRRDLFLKLGAYREALHHQGEEEDFCIRMLAAGFVVRAGRADPIRHYESPKRDYKRWDLYGRRNNVLYVWHNVPLRYLPGHLAGTTWNGIRLGMARGRPLRMMHGLALGFLAIPGNWRGRRPVDAATYRLDRYIRSHQPVRFSEIQGRLPGSHS
jgi:glycosyltransferase involved in cell wall biosynthesis